MCFQMKRIYKPKKCAICGKEFTPTTGVRITCSKECARENKRRYKKNGKQLKKPKKKTAVQSVSEILKIGRAHGIYSYGKIVQALERGEIE